MEWRRTRYVIGARTNTLVAAVLTVSGCKEVPLEDSHTAAQLHQLLNKPLVCEPRASNPRSAWVPDFEECTRDARAKAEKIKQALVRLHARELASAPACVHRVHLSRAAVSALGGDPDVSDPIAEMLSRDAVISSVFKDGCAAAVCEWRRRYVPEKESEYCRLVRDVERDDNAVRRETDATD